MSAVAWIAPSGRLMTVRRTQLAAGSLPVLAAAGAFGTIGLGLAWGGVLGLGVVLLAVVGEYFLRRRVRAWGYAERDDDLLIRRGVLISKLSVVPYGRMQYVDVTAGPFERAFGLATVRMHTAAAASDARIPGLLAPEAARLRDALAALGEARATGL
ncbi:MAG TPA: PH domain-containing protein [Mycobacteriales bacterium]|nr:PH domain-containing protein [Mycobacteriales bacterium]